MTEAGALELLVNQQVIAAMKAHELLDEREADAGSLVAARPSALDAV